MARCTVRRFIHSYDTPKKLVTCNDYWLPIRTKLTID
jgi:hypothetical protein